MNRRTFLQSLCTAAVVTFAGCYGFSPERPRRRRLRVHYSVEAAEDVAAWHGVGVEDELVRKMAEDLERDPEWGRVLDELDEAMRDNLSLNENVVP